MIRLYRAKLSLVAATLIAAVLLATQLPLGELLHQRSQLAAATTELSVVAAHNRQLVADVAALQQRATIAEIAHQEYGLVWRGQRAFVVLPETSAATSSSGSLGFTKLAPADLVAGDGAALAGSGIAPSPPTPAAPQPGLWTKVLARVEFWRWAF